MDLEDSGRPCTLELIKARTTVTLTRPLGDRLLFDSGTGLPVLREALRHRTRWFDLHRKDAGVCHMKRPAGDRISAGVARISSSRVVMMA
ncbi:hypothetical protein ACFY05_06525 [Microtetraspora fusca]|uniref:ATP-binding protein n=1 Tax=Microtetraspora fusca TaxID=1997 RepID=A0ABW6UZM3_MICFU